MFARVIAIIGCLTCCTGCLVTQVGVSNPIPGLSTVAVAPFFNLSAEPAVDGRRFADAYFAELQKTPGFQVIPVGVVEQAIYDNQLELNNPDDALRLADILNVDAVVVGAVTDYQPYYPPRIGLQVAWFTPHSFDFFPGVQTDPTARRRLLDSQEKRERDYQDWRDRQKTLLDMQREAEANCEGPDCERNTPPHKKLRVPIPWIIRGQSMDPAPGVWDNPDRQVRRMDWQSTATSVGQASTALYEVSDWKPGSVTRASHAAPPPVPGRPIEGSALPSGFDPALLPSSPPAPPLAPPAAPPAEDVEPAPVQKPAPQVQILPPAPEDPETPSAFTAAAQPGGRGTQHGPLPPNCRSGDCEDCIFPVPPLDPLVEFVPDAPIQLDPRKPLMSYTRMFDGSDADLVATLRDYVELSGDLRSGGWEAYMYRSEDYIRFTAHLMIVEMLTLHGGEGKHRFVIKQRKFK